MQPSIESSPKQGLQKNSILRSLYVFFANIEKTSWFLYGAGFVTRFAFVIYLFLLGGTEFIGGADHSQYQALAKNMVMNHVFSLSTIAPFIPDGLRTPGYPLFLGISFALTGGFFLAAFIQVCMGAFIPVLIRKIGLTLGISSRASMLAAFIGILDLNFLSNTASLQTEGLFMPLFLFSIWYALGSLKDYSWKRAGILGILFGILALIRPVFLYVGVGFLVAMALLNLWRYKKAVCIGVISISAMMIVLSPWALRNHQQFGSYDLASIGPVNMYTRLAVSVLSVRDGVPFGTSYKNALHNLALEGKIPDLDYPTDESVLYDIRYNTLFNDEALSVIKENPGAFLKLQANSVFAILTHDNTLNILQVMNIAPLDAYPHFSVSLLFLTVPFGEFISRISSVVNGWYVIPFIGRAFWVLVSLFAGMGVVALYCVDTVRSPRKQSVLLVLYCIVGFIAVTLPIALAIDARMRVPIEPFLLLLASHALWGFPWKTWYSGRIFNNKLA